MGFTMEGSGSVRNRERIADCRRLDAQTRGRVLGMQGGAVGIQRGANDEAVPEREPMDSMRIDGGEQVRMREGDDVESGIHDHPAPGMLAAQADGATVRDRRRGSSHPVML